MSLLPSSSLPKPKPVCSHLSFSPYATLFLGSGLSISRQQLTSPVPDSPGQVAWAHWDPAGCPAAAWKPGSPRGPSSPHRLHGLGSLCPGCPCRPHSSPSRVSKLTLFTQLGFVLIPVSSDKGSRPQTQRRGKPHHSPTPPALLLPPGEDASWTPTGWDRLAAQPPQPPLWAPT